MGNKSQSGGLVDLLFFWRESEISDRDRILLTPFNQWRKYRHFPLKIILHFLIVIFVGSQALMISNQFVAYNSANESTFQTIFLPEDYRDGIFSIDEFLDLLQYIVSNYYAFPEYSIGRYAFLYNTTTNEVEPIVMTVSRYQQLDGPFWNHTFLNPDHKIDDEDFDGDFDIVTNRYELTEDNPLSFFDVSERNFELQNLFYYITEVKLEFSFRGINVGSFAVLPFIWDMDIEFKFNGGMIDPQIYVEFRVIHTSGVSGLDIFTALTVSLLIMCVISAMLSVNDLWHNSKVYRRTKSLYLNYSVMALPSDVYPNWKSIPFAVKASFFSAWSVFNIIASIAVLGGCILGLSEELGAHTSSEYYIVFGLGIMLSSANMIRYFEYNKKFFLHVETIRNAAAHIIRFLVSVSPVYWGYAIFGVLNFGPYSWKFANLDAASVTLFALLTGDDIHDTFKDIVDASYPFPWVSRVYIYSFVIIFITTVLNVFIFIIEDAYVLAKISLGIYGDDTSGHQRKELSSIESLRAIFNNLEVWKQRYETRSPGRTPESTPLRPLDQNEKLEFPSDLNVDEELQRISPAIAAIISRNQEEFLNESEALMRECRERFQTNLKRDILQALRK